MPQQPQYPEGFNPDPIGFTPDETQKPIEEESSLSRFTKSVLANPTTQKVGRWLMTGNPNTPQPGDKEVITGMEGSLLPELTHPEGEGWGGYLARGAYNQLVRPLGSATGIIGASQPKGFTKASLKGRLAGIGNQAVDIPLPKEPLALPPSPTRGLELPPAGIQRPISWGLPEGDIPWKGGPSMPYGGTVEQLANQPALEAQFGGLAGKPQIQRTPEGWFKTNYNIGPKSLPDYGGSEQIFPAELPTAGPKPFTSTYPKLEKPVIDITPVQGRNILFEIKNAPPEIQMGVLPKLKDAVEKSALISPEEKALTARSIIQQIGNTFKTAAASVDLSAPLRQGKGLITHKEYWKNLPAMVKSFGSENFYKNMMESIAEHPNYQILKDKVSLTGFKDSMSAKEEAFLGNWLENIPILGAPVRASDRAYSAFLNKTRFDVANKLLGNVQKANANNSLFDLEKATKQIGRLVNAASGRGSLGFAEKYADDLNTIFFSPRFQASRLTMLTDPRFYLSLPKGARLEGLRSAIGIAGAWTTELALLKAAGGKFVDDPTSSDFGKAIFGKTRVDPGAGFAQYLTFFARLFQNKTTSTTGNVKELNQKGFGSVGRQDLLWSSDPFRRGLVENKLAPLAVLFNDWWKGQKGGNQPNEYPRDIYEKAYPMFLRDMYEVIQSDPELLKIVGPLGLFGESVQTFRQ